MKKMLGVQGFVFILLSGVSQGAQPTINLEMCEVKISDMPWKRDTATVFSCCGNKMGVAINSMVLNTQPFMANITFNYTHNGVQTNTILNGEFREMDPSEITNFPEFNPQTMCFSDYLTQLKRTVSQKFCWTDPNGTDLGDFGSPELMFINKHKNHTVNFHQSIIFDSDKNENKTTFKIKYYFEGKPDAHHFPLYSMEHSSTSQELPGILYLNGQRQLQNVKTILYTTVPDKYQEMATGLRLSKEKYTDLVQDPNFLQIALYPDQMAPNKIKPQDGALNKYYRISTGTESPSKYIWTDGLNNFYFTRKKEVQVFEQNPPVKLADRVDFTDKLGGSKILTILEKTYSLLQFPSHLQGLQGRFEKGFYYLNACTNTLTGLDQSWIEEPSNINPPVSVKIDGVKVNGAWVSLVGFPHMTPFSQNGKIVFNLTTVLHSMNDDQYKDLIKYLTSVTWLEGKPPVIQSSFNSLKTIVGDNVYWNAWDKTCERLNQITNDMNSVELELSDGVILENKGNKTWELTPASWGAHKTKQGLYKIFPTYGKVDEFSKNNSEVQNINFGTNRFSFLGQNETLFFIGSDKVKNIPWNDIYITDPCYLNHDQINKLLPKLGGVKKFEVPGMKLEHWIPLPQVGVKQDILNQALARNAATITHLNCAGLKDLGHRDDHFVKAVQSMVNLQTINTLGAGLSNNDIILLAKALEDKQNLKEVSIDMPYHLSGGLELTTKVYGDFVHDATKSQSFVSRMGNTLMFGGQILLAPIAGPMTFAIGSLVDIFDWYGLDFGHALLHLNKIKNLERLNLHLCNVIKWEDYLRQKINEFRQRVYLLNTVTVNFV